MNIRLNNKPTGVVLLVALLVIVVAGIVLASYLKLMQSENKSVARSQIWNKCVPVMEAGVEEAMAQIEACGNSTNLSTNGWILRPVGTNNYYQKTNTVGTNGNYFVVSILPVLPPVIYSTGYVPVPGTSTNYIARKVKVTTQYNLVGGISAKGTISLGGTAQIDSYDSSVGPYGGSNVGSNALVLTDATSAGAISLTGNAAIDGTAVTGPGGSVNGAASATGGIGNDANVQFNDPVVPGDTNSWIPISSPLGGTGPNNTNYTYLLNSANYYVSGSVTLSGGNQTIGVFGNVQLFIGGSLSVGSQSSIYVATNASLTIYLAGNLSIGAGGVVNSSKIPPNLTIYGLPTCTSVSLGGGGAFYGLVDAPEANFTFNGNFDFYGAMIANTISITGTPNIHFDQALSHKQPFIAASWNEL